MYVVLPKIIPPPLPEKRIEEKVSVSWTSQLLNYLPYVVPVVAILIIALLVFRRRIKQSKSSEAMLSQLRIKYEELRDVDLEILKILKKHGGTIMQSELQKILNVPKTTLWRAVKRLEQLGYIRIEKIHGLNKLILLKDVDVESL